MSDYYNNLQTASWKGVTFNWESIQHTGGRRVQIHEFIKRDDPFVEDLGLMTKQFSITGYFVGDDASEIQSLQDVCEEPGPGEFVHPLLGSQTAALVAPLEALVTKDKGRLYTFTLKFVFTTQSEATNTAKFPSSDESTAKSVENSVNDLKESSSSDFLSNVRSAIAQGRNAINAVRNTVTKYTRIVTSAISSVRRVINSVMPIANLLGAGSSLGRFLRSTNKIISSSTQLINTPARLVNQVNSAVNTSVRAATMVSQGVSKLTSFINRL